MWTLADPSTPLVNETWSTTIVQLNFALNTSKIDFDSIS